MSSDSQDIRRAILAKWHETLSKYGNLFSSDSIIAVAMFAAVGMFSSTQLAEASHKVVLVFNGKVGVGVFPLQVAGRVSGDDFDSPTGQGFDAPIPGNSKFYCTIAITDSSRDGDVVTLSGITTFSTFAPVNENPVPVVFTVNLDTGFITFNFDGAPSGDGFGNVRVPHQ